MAFLCSHGKLERRKVAKRTRVRQEGSIVGGSEAKRGYHAILRDVFTWVKVMICASEGRIRVAVSKRGASRGAATWRAVNK